HRLRRGRLARAAAEAAAEAALPRFRRQRVRGRALRPQPQPALRPFRRLRTAAPLPAGGPAGVQRRVALPVHPRTGQGPARAGRAVRRDRLPGDLRPRRPGRRRRARVPRAPREVLSRALPGAGLRPPRFALLALAGAALHSHFVGNRTRPVKWPQMPLPPPALRRGPAIALALAGALGAAAPHASAAEPPADPPTATTDLDPVVVHGERPREDTVPNLAQARARLDERAGGTTLVDGGQYRDGRVGNLADALGFAPGVFVQPRFGAEEARLSIRG